MLRSMRTTYDAEVDAAYIALIPEEAPGNAVRTVEVETTGGSVVLDFDDRGVLLGIEVLGAAKVLDESILAGAVRIDE